MELMEKGRTNIRDIGEKARISQRCVGYHLRLLLKQKVVTMSLSGHAGRWTLTKYGQEKLFET